MAHGDRAARNGTWGCGREHWTGRPLATSVGGRHHADDTKARSHRIERARARAETRVLRAKAEKEREEDDLFEFYRQDRLDVEWLAFLDSEFEFNHDG